MASQPWLSVLMPIYNGEDYLRYALDSIAIQNDNNIECIAVDGESTDTTLPILKSYQGKIPIKIVQHEKKSNWIVKTNYALSLAQGEYACFLHHDDLWLKDRLNIIKQLAEQFPEAALLLHPSRYLDNKGNDLGLWSCPLPSFPEKIKPNIMIERLLVQNFISILGPVFKRKAAIAIGGLDELLWYTADWDFWLKISTCGDTLYYPKPLSGFRIHSSSQTIVRSSGSPDFREQLESVARKHFVNWQVSTQRKQKVQKVAEFSIEVNVVLAGTAHGQKTDLFKLLISFVMLGPAGWFRYIRYSRIWERVTARLKARLIQARKS